MPEEEVLKRCIAQSLLVLTKGIFGADWISVGQKRRVENEKSWMRELSFVAEQHQSHLECGVCDRTDPFAVVFAMLSVNAQIEGGLIE